MKPGLRTLVSMLAGWAAPLVVWGIHQFRHPWGNLHDFSVFALWTAVFAAISWGAVVVPVMTRWGWLPWWSDVRRSWLSWSLLGVATYSVLVLPLAARELFELVWYPAIVGAVAGVVYALLKPPPDLPCS